MIPRFMPMFSNACSPNQSTTPLATSRPNRSRARNAMVSPRHSTTASSPSRTHTPTKPSSSPATENTKSVWLNGTKPPWVWLPWPSPRPSSPPAPIAIRACWVL